MQDPVPIALASVPETPMRVLIRIRLGIGVVAYTDHAFGKALLVGIQFCVTGWHGGLVWSARVSVLFCVLWLVHGSKAMRGSSADLIAVLLGCGWMGSVDG